MARGGDNTHNRQYFFYITISIIFSREEIPAVTAKKAKQLKPQASFKKDVQADK